MIGTSDPREIAYRQTVSLRLVSTSHSCDAVILSAAAVHVVTAAAKRATKGTGSVEDNDEGSFFFAAKSPFVSLTSTLVGEITFLAPLGDLEVRL